MVQITQHPFTVSKIDFEGFPGLPSIAIAASDFLSTFTVGRRTPLD
jgi:hypothetical protein